MTSKSISIFMAFTMILQMNPLNVYAAKDSKESQKAITAYDESSNKIKEEFSQNGNEVTQYINKEDEKLKTIVWTKGIKPPKMGGEDSEFRRVPTYIGGKLAYVEYIAPYIKDRGWYDVNKTEDKIIDKNLCFAAGTANMLHWWLEQNSGYIDQYLAKNPNYPKAEKLKSFRNSFKGQADSEIYKTYRNEYAYRASGYWSDILADQFINGYTPKPGGGTNTSELDREKLLKNGPDSKGGFFYDIFGPDLLTDRRNYRYNYEEFSKDIKENFLKGNIVLMDYYTGNIKHVVTLWGAEYDLNGKISAVYLSDSDDDKSQGMIRYMVKNLNGRPVISTKLDGTGNDVEYLQILSLGKEIWEEKLNQNPESSKKTLNLSWGKTDFTYNGEKQKPTVSATNIENGDNVTVSVEGEQINVGTYTATAVLSGQSSNKYKLPNEHTKTFTIKKAQAQINLSANTQHNKNTNTVTLTANVSGVNGEKPDGSITFKAGDTVIASNIKVLNGEASYLWTNPTEGKHSIVAEFSPSTDGIGKNYEISISNTVSFDVTAQSNNAPKINGADNVTIKVGEVKDFNLLAGITVTDDRDENLIPTVSGSIGKPSPGTNKDYTIIYTVKDTDGNTTTVTRVIKVTNQLPIIEGLNDITINKGENADLKKGVTAKDNEDGILTDKIVFPTINLSTLREGKHQVTYEVTDSDGNSRSEKRIINVKKNNSSEDKPSKPFSSLRLGGRDRYNTAIEIAKKFQDGKMLDNVVIANALNFPDALTGSALASSLNAPILLTYTNYTPKTDTIEYIKSNLKKEGTVYLLGSTGVVPDGYINELKAAGFTKFVRLGGSDRYATNLEIVNRMNVKEGTPIFVANSTAFADSLSASPISAAKGMPIFLSFKDSMPEKTMNAIKKIKPSKIYIVGSNGVISEGLANQLSNIAPITRLGGADRYDTCLTVNKHFNLDTENAIIASGLDFPDALTGSVLAAKLNAPVILLSSSVGEKQKTYIDSGRMRNLYILGGKNLITDTMVNELKK